MKKRAAPRKKVTVRVIKRSSLPPSPRGIKKRSAAVPAKALNTASESAPQFSLVIRRVLVPIDFSVHSKNALRYAVPMAEAFGASLHLVYVVEPTIYPADLGFGQVVLPGVEDELRDKGAEELKKLVESEIGNRVKATSTVRTGKPHQEILREAAEKEVDLIIVASHGHTGVEHILFGSTAARVVRLSTCPVLTIRPSVMA